MFMVKSLSILTILGNVSSFSWNLNFHHNLTNLKIEDYGRM